MNSYAPDISLAYPASSYLGELAEINTTGVAPLHMDQFLGEWAIALSHGDTLLSRFAELDLASHIAANAKRQPTGAKGKIDNSSFHKIGVVQVNGALTKHGSSMGSGADSLIQIGRMVDNMAKDASIDAIVLDVDSPGGTVAGTQQLARKIARAREAKPVVTWVQDLAASAAVWISSQADAVYVNVETAVIGSIGTFIGVLDYSSAYEKAGVKAIAIRARSDRKDNMKGLGFRGTEITKEQIAKLEAHADSSQDHFSRDVAAGRGITFEAVEKIANGQVYHASDEEASILHDGIADWDEVLDRVSRMIGKPAGKERREAASASADQITPAPQAESSDPAPTPPPATETTPMSTEATTTAPAPAPQATTPAPTPAPAPAPNPVSVGSAPSPAPAASSPMSIAELKATFPNAGADFYLSQVEFGATLQTASVAFGSLMQARAEAAEEERDQAKAAAGRTKNEPVGAGTKASDSIEASGDAEAEFSAEVDKLAAAAGIPRIEAHRQVCSKQPDLRLRMVAAVNQRMGRHDQANAVLRGR